MNLTYCTGHLHRKALGTSPSSGGMGHPPEKSPKHQLFQGSGEPWVLPTMAAGSPQTLMLPHSPWHEADKDSRHQCGVHKICS